MRRRAASPTAIGASRNSKSWHFSKKSEHSLMRLGHSLSQSERRWPRASYTIQELSYSGGSFILPLRKIAVPLHCLQGNPWGRKQHSLIRTIKNKNQWKNVSTFTSTALSLALSLLRSKSSDCTSCKHGWRSPYAWLRHSVFLVVSAVFFVASAAFWVVSASAFGVSGLGASTFFLGSGFAGVSSMESWVSELWLSLS